MYARRIVKAVDRLNCRATLSPATLFRGTRPKPRQIASVGSPSLEEEIPKESQPSKEKIAMKTFVSLVVALGLATVATSSAFAGAPKNQADCEKAHMKWDATAKKCSK